MARRRSRFVRPPARTKMWIGSGVGLTAVAGDTEVLVSTLTASALLLRPFTVLRTHLDIMWTSDQQIASEAPMCSYGHVVVTDTAASVGITALPNPSGVDGDPDASWFVWQGMSTALGFATAVGVWDEGSHFTIDSHAMRKVGPNDDIAVLADGQFASGGTLFSMGRRLIQLH